MLDQPRFYMIGGEKLVSVTTFLRVLSKPFLMPWYVKMERENILDIINNNGEVLNTIEEIKRSFFYNKKGEVSGYAAAADAYVKKAAALGRNCHNAVENYLKDNSYKAKLTEREMERYKTWKEWWLQSGFKLKDQEETVYDLALGYAGTLDARAVRDNEEYIIDWKFGKGAGYPENHLQNIAYRYAAYKKAKGLIVHIPSGGGPVVEIPIDPKYTIDHVRACLTLWHMENGK